MRTALSALAVLLVGVVPADAAAAEFQLVAGGPQRDRGVSVAPLRDGGFLAVGSTSAGEAGDDVFLVRTDGSGRELWRRAAGGAGADFGWDVVELADGFLIAGFTSDGAGGEEDCLLLRTDAEGRESWSRTYGGPGAELCWALLPAAQDGFLLVGQTALEEGEEDCLLVRVDAAGEPLWTRAFGGAKSDRCFGAAAAESGGWVVAGQTYSEGGGDRDAWIVRIGADGRTVWDETFGGEASDVAHAIVRLRDGDFLVTGYTTSLAVEPDDPYLVKIAEDGEVRWARVLPLPGMTRAITGTELTSGELALTGFVRDAEGGAALFVRADAEGELLEVRDLFRTTRGDSFGYTIRPTEDGGAVIAGHTTEGSAGHLDLFLARVAGGED